MRSIFVLFAFFNFAVFIARSHLSLVQVHYYISERLSDLSWKDPNINTNIVLDRAQSALRKDGNRLIWRIVKSESSQYEKTHHSLTESLIKRKRVKGTRV